MNHFETDAIPPVCRPKDSRAPQPPATAVGNSRDCFNLMLHTLHMQSQNETFRNEKGGGSKMERCASKASTQENGTAVPFFPGVRLFPYTATHAETRFAQFWEAASSLFFEILIGD